MSKPLAYKIEENFLKAPAWPAIFIGRLIGIRKNPSLSSDPELFEQSVDDQRVDAVASRLVKGGVIAVIGASLLARKLNNDR